MDFYTFACISTRIVSKAISRVEVCGVENMPRTGPVILAPNHLHFVDPPVLGAYLPRRIHFMVKYEAWTAPVLGIIVRNYDSFPVHRGEGDLGAFRRALKLLAGGHVVGIFPEGHRSRDGHLQEGQPGAVILAQRARAPIVPVGIWGVREVLHFPGIVQRRTIRIVVGEPYHPPPGGREAVPEATRQLMERIAALLPT